MCLDQVGPRSERAGVWRGRSRARDRIDQEAALAIEVLRRERDVADVERVVTGVCRREMRRLFVEPAHELVFPVTHGRIARSTRDVREQ